MTAGEKPVRAPLTVSALQATVDRWINTYGVRYFAEMTNLAVLMEEVGELARIMARTYGEQSFKEEETATELGDELADVLFVLVCIANHGCGSGGCHFKKPAKQHGPGQAPSSQQSEVDVLAYIWWSVAISQRLFRCIRVSGQKGELS
jgi:NTP pyrophosphatase (non-canonical NTP hydrolase)